LQEGYIIRLHKFLT